MVFSGLLFDDIYAAKLPMQHAQPFIVYALAKLQLNGVLTIFGVAKEKKFLTAVEHRNNPTVTFILDPYVRTDFNQLVRSSYYWYPSIHHLLL